MGTFIRADPKKRLRVDFYVGALLAAGTLLLYWPAVGYGFIVADDYQYILQNPPVLKGLSWEGIRWAFWSMYADNWHPLTWVSHMLDCSLYGLYPGGHHLTNVLFHAANTVLLFFLLKRLTGRLWPSALAAALFGWHPLHVESVAWICERKDVLSTFFFLLTLHAYCYYAAKPRRGRFLLTLAFFAFGLMSKPMLVTLPCVLLLLDYWPLRRINTGPGKAPWLVQWKHLVVEKVPFFFLTLVGCVLTVMAQSANGAVKSTADVPLLVHLVNPICSYGRYLAKAIWPGHMVVFYPLPANPAWALFAVASPVIFGCTCLAIYWRSKLPWFIVGWLWFLGTLVPVIGIVQVGTQAMADRYTYIPYIGLFIVVVWGANYILQKWPAARLLALPTVLAVFAACIIVTRHQMNYWRSSLDVFGHAVSLTAENAFSNGNLNYALAEAKRGSDAIPRYDAIVNVTAERVIGRPLLYDTALIGKRDDEATQLRELLNYDPNEPVVYDNLGIVLFEQGKPEEAIEQFERAARLDSKLPWAYFNEAIVLQEQGKAAGAVTNYMKAIVWHPAWPEALDKLAYLLATCPSGDGRDAARAIELAARANELTDRTSPGYLRTLAIAYGAGGSFSNAVVTGEMAGQKAEAAGMKTLAADLRNETMLYRNGKLPAFDWRKPPARVIVSRKNEVLPPGENSAAGKI